jgi:hypothetical protein
VREQPGHGEEHGRHAEGPRACRQS